MKKRYAVRHYLDNLWHENYRQFQFLDANSIHLYIEMTNPDEIIEIMKDESRFKHIIYEIFSRTGNNEMYRNLGTAVYEMRFNGNPNSRIFCKEIKEAGKPMKIVMSNGIRNKGTTGKKLQKLFIRMEKYDFDFFETYQEYEKTTKSNRRLP